MCAVKALSDRREGVGAAAPRGGTCSGSHGGARRQSPVCCHALPRTRRALRRGCPLPAGASRRRGERPTPFPGGRAPRWEPPFPCLRMGPRKERAGTLSSPRARPEPGGLWQGLPHDGRGGTRSRAPPGPVPAAGRPHTQCEQESGCVPVIQPGGPPWAETPVTETCVPDSRSVGTGSRSPPLPGDGWP